jgi:hypothetical protein
VGGNEKRLDRIRRSPHGWSHDYLERLVVSFGFEVRGGSKHGYYVDPDDETNIVRIPRHKPVKDYVVNQVVTAIERRIGRQETDT